MENKDIVTFYSHPRPKRSTAKEFYEDCIRPNLLAYAFVFGTLSALLPVTMALDTHLLKDKQVQVIPSSSADSLDYIVR